MPNHVPSNTWTLRRIVLTAAVLCAGGATLSAASPIESTSADDLTRLSLSDLANVEVTSVSKSSQSLQRAAASIFVITHDDIQRSSATNVFEALRLAPNLLVTQVSATSYTVASRGFGGNPTSQNFANKLLILVDGRSVYTPLYSGIYSFALDVMLEDVDRIEVISGPGATLWGANAMNGVINIITRAANLTSGDMAAAPEKMLPSGSTAMDFNARPWKLRRDKARAIAGAKAKQDFATIGPAGRTVSRCRGTPTAPRNMSWRRKMVWRSAGISWLASNTMAIARI
jgi:outer membrane receptor protein involved in Fe transport